MVYTFTAPSLTKPTHDTLEEYSKRMFKKIERFVDSSNASAILKISVDKDGDNFSLKSEIHVFEEIIIKVKDRDLRRAIEKAAHEMKSKLLKDKEKKISFRGLRNTVSDIKGKLLNR